MLTPDHRASGIDRPGYWARDLAQGAPEPVWDPRVLVVDHDHERDRNDLLWISQHAKREPAVRGQGCALRAESSRPMGSKRLTTSVGSSARSAPGSTAAIDVTLPRKGVWDRDRRIHWAPEVAAPRLRPSADRVERATLGPRHSGRCDPGSGSCFRARISAERGPILTRPDPGPPAGDSNRGQKSARYRPAGPCPCIPSEEDRDAFQVASGGSRPSNPLGLAGSHPMPTGSLPVTP